MREVIGKPTITIFYDITPNETRKELQYFETKTRNKYERGNKSYGLGPNPRVSALQN